MKNTMPPTKLTKQTRLISTMKPMRSSERCGVMTAENIAGSEIVLLSALMAPTIRKHGAKDDQSHQRCQEGQSRRGQAAQGAQESRYQGRTRRDAAMEQVRGRGSVPPFCRGKARTQG